ncbi:MAG: ribonuclease, partial [Actinomycetota bacterium]|nr:ribonuclease [Actinomycetota bacterium]
TANGGLGVPEYLVSESGPDHQKLFQAVVQVGGEPYGTGSGRSKKEAEQEAAASAWRSLRTQLGEGPGANGTGANGTGAGTDAVGTASPNAGDTTNGATGPSH